MTASLPGFSQDSASLNMIKHLTYSLYASTAISLIFYSQLYLFACSFSQKVILVYIILYLSEGIVLLGRNKLFLGVENISLTLKMTLTCAVLKLSCFNCTSENYAFKPFSSCGNYSRLVVFLSNTKILNL